MRLQSERRARFSVWRRCALSSWEVVGREVSNDATALVKQHDTAARRGGEGGRVGYGRAGGENGPAGRSELKRDGEIRRV
jgi:hypothetical protein